MADDDHIQPDRDAAAADDVSSARPRRRWLFAGIAVASVVFVLLALPIYSTLQPAYYARYPDLHERMENWRGSTHARIPCSGCHIDPGVTGLARFTVRAVPAFYSQLIWGPKPSNLLQVPDREACQKCHTSYRQVSARGDLRIPHKAHVEVLGVNCPVCHKDLVHSANDEGFNRPEMSTCLETCHDGTKAKDECVACHTRKEVPENHLAKDWLTIHAEKTASVNCGECHAWSPDYCRECHLKRPKSHVGNWKNDHQYRAKERGTKGCMFCHAEKFCKQCH